ncbi:MAG TPA: MBL fold metallo-hydrolase [Gemmataceae bacterium]
MPAARTFSELRLVNGSTGDPVLYLDYPGGDNALLFDAGDTGALDLKRLGDLEAVFLTHHHIDHFVGFDRILRANIDRDKALHVFGPAGTIRKVYDRIKSYEIQFFPFQKLALVVHDLADGEIRRARLECSRRFPEPEVESRPWKGRVIYENADLQVEAVAGDHTVPCFAYAMAEKTGFHPDPAKLAAGVLRPGPWVQEALGLLRAGKPRQTVLEIQGGRFELGRLADQYFAESPGARVAYVTDTAWTEETRPRLTQLAKGAWRLYCDSYYASAQLKQAAVHKHMTAAHAAELAKAAKVDRLVLMHFGGRYAGRYEALVNEAKEIFPRACAEIGPAA